MDLWLTRAPADRGREPSGRHGNIHAMKPIHAQQRFSENNDLEELQPPAIKQHMEDNLWEAAADAGVQAWDDVARLGESEMPNDDSDVLERMQAKREARLQQEARERQQHERQRRQRMEQVDAERAAFARELAEQQARHARQWQDMLHRERIRAYAWRGPLDSQDGALGHCGVWRHSETGACDRLRVCARCLQRRRPDHHYHQPSRALCASPALCRFARVTHEGTSIPAIRQFCRNSALRQQLLQELEPSTVAPQRRGHPLETLCAHSVPNRAAIVALASELPAIVTRNAMLSVCANGDAETFNMLESHVRSHRQWGDGDFVRWLWLDASSTGSTTQMTPTITADATATALAFQRWSRASRTPGRTPFHACIAGGHSALLRDLVCRLRAVLHHATDAFLAALSRIPIDGTLTAPLQCALEQGCFDVAEWLAAVDVHMVHRPFPNGKRPLEHFSQSDENVRAVRKLLSLGADASSICSITFSAQAVRRIQNDLWILPFVTGLHPRLGHSSPVRRLRHLDRRVLKLVFSFLCAKRVRVWQLYG